MIRTHKPIEPDHEMLTEPIDDALLEQLVKRVLETTPASAIVLFGSRAGGGPTHSKRSRQLASRPGRTR